MQNDFLESSISDLVGNEQSYKKAIPSGANAPNSNLPPFDIKLKPGEDPLQVAKELTKETDFLDVSIGDLGVEKVKPVVPAQTKRPINTNIYGIDKIVDQVFSGGRTGNNTSSKIPTITPEESSGVMTALNKVWGLATHPYDIVKGSTEFIASLPGFGEGMLGAAWEVSKALGKGANLSEVYDAASKGMEENMASWNNTVVGPLGRLLDIPYKLADKAADKYLGMKPREEDYSSAVGDIAMAPLNLVTKATHDLADSHAYDNYPTIRGAIKFGGDVLGLLTIGRIYHGGAAEYAKDVKPIIEKADAINKRQKAVSEIPDEVLRTAQEKVLEVEKNQLELEAKALQDKIDHAKIIEEDLKAKGQEVKDIKEGKKSFAEDPLGIKAEIDLIDAQGKAEGLKQYAEMKDAQQKKVSKKVYKEKVNAEVDMLEKSIEDVQPKEIGEEAKPNELQKEKKEKKVESKTPELDELTRIGKTVEETITELQAGIDDPKQIRWHKTYQKKIDAINKEIKSTEKKAKTKKVAAEPITDVDLQTGTPIPEALNTENHPFRDKRVEHTNSMSKVFQERIGKTDTSPEVFTRYLINEVNRYLNGEEVDIAKVRNSLSEIATKADRVRLNFENVEDFNAWRDIAKDAASWARGADRLTNKRTGGTTLRMGIDPTQIPEATKKIIAGAKALAAYTAKARGMKEWKPGVAAESIKEELVRSFVDRSGNIRKELLDKLGDDGYEIIQKMYLSKGASSLAAQQLKQMRDEVYAGLNKNDKRILDNLILADRMLDIGKYKTASQFKFPEGLSPMESAAYNELFQFTEKITPEKAELLKQRAQAYFEWMKKPLKDMLDAELIDQAEYDALASHNYRRLKLVDVFDKRYQSKVGKAKRTVYDSGVESLSHGRETDVFEPSSEVMALEVFNRAYGRILNNAANKTLLDLARNQKDNPFVTIKEKPDDRVPSGWDRVFVYEKGERKALYLSPEMSKEWITNNPEMSYKLSQTIRYASGSPVLRTFATGIDWDFALRNLPRDVMHIWYAARVFEEGKWKPLYNTSSPIYSYQMSADIAGVFHDALMRKGKYQEYIREGGGMEFLVHQGRLMQRGRHIEGTLDKVQDFLGYIGETSEIMTRLAIRDRVIKRRANEQGISYEEAAKDKKITQEATFAARDYMDFGQGGGISKALDNGIPYLNASIQGTRGLFRAFKDSPKESTLKLAQFAAVVTGLYIASNKFNPRTMQALQGDIATQSNICIPLGDGFSFEDEKGQTRYLYLKVLPLDPGQKFFKKFFEASTDKWLGNPIDVDGTVNTLSQLSPVGISSLPPVVSGSLGYTYNKNFWTGEDIWKKTDKPFGWPNSKEEYIPGKTPQVFQDFGELTGMSPERTKYAVGQLFTSGTMWGQLVGAGYDALFGDLPKKYKEMHMAEILSKMPITKNFIGITNPYSQFVAPINEAKEQSMLKRWVENRGLDQRVESFLYEGGKRSDVTDYIRTTSKDQATEDRLKDRFIFQEKIKELPNRSFWLSLKGTPDTDARAKLYVQRLDSATPEEKEQLRKEESIVYNAGGVISDEFKEAVMKLRYKK
jgi:hypothetical protein